MNHLTHAYRANVRSFERMIAKAKITGRPVGGYTLADLERIAREYTALADLSQPQMIAHLADTSARIARAARRRPVCVS